MKQETKAYLVYNKAGQLYEGEPSLVPKAKE